MFIRIWQFRARPESEAAFRAAYGRHGAWAALFARAAGYLGTELLQSTTEPSTYLTIDRWDSAESWTTFLGAWQRDYAALDEKCETLTTSEVEVGAYRMSPAD